nr:reverse transcriptase domain-containing protein [Tanacetum cinerariifolium]
TIRDWVYQSSIEEFQNLILDDIVDFRIDPSLMLKRWLEVFLHENFNHYKSGFLLNTQIFSNNDWKLIVTFQKCVFEMRRRSFLKTERYLIDVFEGELTFRVGKEAITFNLDQTSGYSANYNDMTANRIDVIDMACKEYSQEVLSFSNVIASGNPTPYYDPIVSTTSLTLTPFENNDFLLEEVDAFLALKDDPISPEVDQSYVDTEGPNIFNSLSI